MSEKEPERDDVIPTPLPVKKKRMRRSKSDKPRDMYFHAGTQAAIVSYQNSDDRKERERLYVQDIMPAFVKLTENLINIHKFTSLHDTQEELKNDCVNFLFETIKKFDNSRGTNAFSYFNVVAKRFLIVRTKQRAQKIKKTVSLDDINSLTQNDQRTIEDYCTVASQDEQFEKETASRELIRALYEIKRDSTSEHELLCINAIISLFENANDIDVINRNAASLYIREMSGLQQKQLSVVMQSIKKKFKQMWTDSEESDES